MAVLPDSTRLSLNSLILKAHVVLDRARDEDEHFKAGKAWPFSWEQSDMSVSTCPGEIPSKHNDLSDRRYTGLSETPPEILLYGILDRYRLTFEAHRQRGMLLKPPPAQTVVGMVRKQSGTVSVSSLGWYHGWWPDGIKVVETFVDDITTQLQKMGRGEAVGHVIRDSFFHGPAMSIIHATSADNKASILTDCWIKGTPDRSMSWDAPEGASLAVHAGCNVLKQQVTTCFMIRAPHAVDMCCHAFGPARLDLDIDHHLEGKWHLCIPKEPNPAWAHDFWDVYLVRAAPALHPALSALFPTDFGRLDPFADDLGAAGGVYTADNARSLNDKLSRALDMVTEVSGRERRPHLHLHVLTAAGVPLPPLPSTSAQGGAAGEGTAAATAAAAMDVANALAAMRV